eukprot:gnl/Dysnectes_brevis/810_a895_1796.p1 GENE.gnl/Dysnectes_brevis/810_a895_1796~~gnl/Dysnectes_brevis/810_a895_1796.p1  ORF type:complete len:740 (+),score=197.66 gnl/Dysnectes_brevis/810_a895_1796:28-2220(+)
MKISLVGKPGVGKTCLVNYLSKRWSPTQLGRLHPPLSIRKEVIHASSNLIIVDTLPQADDDIAFSTSLQNTDVVVLLFNVSSENTQSIIDQIMDIRPFLDQQNPPPVLLVGTHKDLLSENPKEPTPDPEDSLSEPEAEEEEEGDDVHDDPSSVSSHDTDGDSLHTALETQPQPQQPPSPQPHIPDLDQVQTACPEVVEAILLGLTSRKASIAVIRAALIAADQPPTRYCLPFSRRCNEPTKRVVSTVYRRLMLAEEDLQWEALGELERHALKGYSVQLLADDSDLRDRFPVLTADALLAFFEKHGAIGQFLAIGQILFSLGYNQRLEIMPGKLHFNSILVDAARKLKLPMRGAETAVIRFLSGHSGSSPFPNMVFEPSRQVIQWLYKAYGSVKGSRDEEPTATELDESLASGRACGLLPFRTHVSLPGIDSAHRVSPAEWEQLWRSVFRVAPGWALGALVEIGFPGSPGTWSLKSLSSSAPTMELVLTALEARPRGISVVHPGSLLSAVVLTVPLSPLHSTLQEVPWGIAHTDGGHHLMLSDMFQYVPERLRDSEERSEHESFALSYLRMLLQRGHLGADILAVPVRDEADVAFLRAVSDIVAPFSVCLLTVAENAGSSQLIRNSCPVGDIIPCLQDAIDNPRRFASQLLQAVNVEVPEAPTPSVPQTDIVPVNIGDDQTSDYKPVSSSSTASVTESSSGWNWGLTLAGAGFALISGGIVWSMLRRKRQR